ncbi:MAG: DUF58 domain-containing protein [Spirochaetaceae bacterium]
MDPSEDLGVPSVFSLGLSLFFVWLLLFFALLRREFTLAAPAAGVLLLMHATRLWSALSLRRLELTISPERDRVFPGEDVAIGVELKNNKPLAIRLRLEIGFHGSLKPEESLQGETRLSPFEESFRVFRLVAVKRGVVPLGPAKVVAGDIFGLHSRRRRYPSDREIVVFPRIRPFRSFPIPFQEYLGIHASKGLVEDPAWYAGTREYSGNRPARNIHWKASARLGVLQEKLFEPTSHRKVLLVLDAGLFGLEEGIPDRGPFEETVEVLASVAKALMETGASFGLVTNAGGLEASASLLPLGRGPEHLGDLLEMLARARMSVAAELAFLFEKATQSAMGSIYFGAEPRNLLPRLYSGGSSRGFGTIFVFARGRAGEEVRGNRWRGNRAYLTDELIDVPGK